MHTKTKQVPLWGTKEAQAHHWRTQVIALPSEFSPLLPLVSCAHLAAAVLCRAEQQGTTLMHPEQSQLHSSSSGQAHQLGPWLIVQDRLAWPEQSTACYSCCCCVTQVQAQQPLRTPIVCGYEQPTKQRQQMPVHKVPKQGWVHDS
jgi:hypothetical protein